MKEDYASEIVFKSASYILFGVFGGFLLSFNFLSDWFLYMAIVGIVVGVYLSIIKFRLKFYEVFDAVVISFLPWLSLMFLGDSVLKSSLTSFVGFLAMLVAIFLYYYFDTHYREFAWYKSGRVGFSGTLLLAIVFLTRSTIATFGITVISFVDKYEAIVSGVFAFIAFLMLFNLSKR